MATIKISYDVPAETVAKIKEYLSEVALRDLNWNGANFKIEYDDYTCIQNDESADAVSLLIEINRIISGD